MSLNKATNKTQEINMTKETEAIKAYSKCNDRLPTLLAQMQQKEYGQYEDGYGESITYKIGAGFKPHHVRGWKHYQQAIDILMRCQNNYHHYNPGQKEAINYYSTQVIKEASHYIEAKNNQHDWWNYPGNIFRHSTTTRQLARQNLLKVLIEVDAKNRLESDNKARM